MCPRIYPVARLSGANVNFDVYHSLWCKEATRNPAKGQDCRCIRALYFNLGQPVVLWRFVVSCGGNFDR